MSQNHLLLNRASFPLFQAYSVVRFLGCVLLLGLFGCGDKTPQTRSSYPNSSGKRLAQTKDTGPGYVEQTENAEDRAETVRRVCTRKASSDLPQCWSDEAERKKNRKFETRIGLMLSISPQGKAEKIDVVSPQPEMNELERCVVDAARTWNFPDGATTAVVRCDFFLRSSQ